MDTRNINFRDPDKERQRLKTEKKTEKKHWIFAGHAPGQEGYFGQRRFRRGSRRKAADDEGLLQRLQRIFHSDLNVFGILYCRGICSIVVMIRRFIHLR